MQRGIFITVEGIEGVGKSTIVAHIATYLQQRAYEVLSTREPGGTQIAERIRQLLLACNEEIMQPETELLLMLASRAQHLYHVIKPALAAGKIVLSDRFSDASYAYQGGGRGIDEHHINNLTTFVQGDLQPDLTILLDAKPKQVLSRISSAKLDRIESESEQFFEKVRASYLQRAWQNTQRFRMVDASLPLKAVLLIINQILAQLLSRYRPNV